MDSLSCISGDRGNTNSYIPYINHGDSTAIQCCSWWVKNGMRGICDLLISAVSRFCDARVTYVLELRTLIVLKKRSKRPFV